MDILYAFRPGGLRAPPVVADRSEATFFFFFSSSFFLQYEKSKELPKCTGLLLLDKPIEYLSDYPNVLRTSITVAINYYFFLKNIYSLSFYHHFQG